MMSPAAVLAVLSVLQDSAIPTWVDGGWGVDALLERQTRPHTDLDLALAGADVAAAVSALSGLGLTLRVDELPTRAELRSEDDWRVDLHPLAFDDVGNGRQQLPDGSFGLYDAAGLAGVGTIGGRTVRCLSAELQLKFHVSYPPGGDDVHDVWLLCERFALQPPGGYTEAIRDIK